MSEAKPRKRESKTPPKSESIPSARIPPHNLDAERAALGCALIDPNGFGRMVDIIDADSFYDRRHALIFTAMARLFNQSAPIDVLSVSEELTREKEIDAAGGAPYLAALSNEEATSAHIEHYASIVREKAVLRLLISASSTLTRDAYEAFSSDELMESAMRQLFEVYSRRQRGGFRAISDVLRDTAAFLDRQGKHEGTITGVGTGFPVLDFYTSGFQRGDLVILAGRPSMGKTAFSLDLARNACLQYNTPVAFFSLEMASMAIAMRLLAAEANMNLRRLRAGKPSDSELRRMTAALSTLSESKIFVDDTGTLGLMELRARARQLKIQHNIGIIFVDYLQLMKPPPADSREQEVAQLSRGLKGLARELNVPVVALSQLSRAVEQRGGDRRPMLSDLRDSGAIEQDADVVMFIYRERQYKSGTEEEEAEIDNTTEIIIRKQRNGPTGTVKLVFNPEFTRFDNLADSVDAARSLEAAPDENAPPF